MKIIVINKEIFHKRPPVISSILNLFDLGYDVELITVEINDYWLQELNSRGIKVYVIPDSKRRNRINKIIEFIRFRKLVINYLHQKIATSDNLLLWVIGGNTIYALGTSLKDFRFILQIQELHENDKNYLRAFGKIIHQAEKIFVPEYARALLYKIWFGLKQIPTVLPNKPYFMPDQVALELYKNEYSSILDNLKAYKIIIYQGYIGRDRDLSNYVKALTMLKTTNNYKLVLMGQDVDGMVKHYKEIDPDILHINYIPAPAYLIFTRLAHIGLLSYSPISENNIFCAPNKLFEYSAYGIPMIGNNILGLSYPIKTNKMGEIVNEEDCNTIIHAIEAIEVNYDEYSRNSRAFFESVDNKATIAKCIDSIR